MASIGLNYQSLIPDLIDIADIQEAFRQYHFGIANYTSGPANVNSIEGHLGLLRTDLTTLQGTVATLNFVSKAGGDTVTASGAGVIPVALKGAAAQTADLTQWKDSTNAVLAVIKSNGHLVTPAVNVFANSGARTTAIPTPVTGTISYLQDSNSLAVYQNSRWTSITLVDINTQVASYSLVLADMNRVVEMDVGSANNLTIPLNATQAFPIGTTIDIIQVGSGQTTLSPTGGVTIQSRGNALKFAGQYGACTLYKRATDTWLAVGDLTI